MTWFSIQKFWGLPALALLLCLSGFPALAQEGPQDGEEDTLKRPIVVELFTAVDCDACVYADRMLYDAMQKDNVIALSCHIKGMGDGGEAQKIRKGPMDPCIFRQWTYETSRRTLDTNLRIPYMVVNGMEEANAGHLGYFLQIMASYNYQGKNKTLEIPMRWKDKETLSVYLPTAAGNRYWHSASLWLVRYKDIIIQRVDQGVNKGRVLRFSNVIQDMRHVGKWHGQHRVIDFKVPPAQGGDERGGYVILAQEMMGEPMLAAGILKDYAHPNDKKIPQAQTSQPQAPQAVPIAPSN
ncbi:MAG: DUF1223 domain-containing protein [Micavibrio sp.]